MTARRPLHIALVLALLLGAGLAAQAQMGGRRGGGGPPPSTEDTAEQAALERRVREHGALAGEFSVHMDDVRQKLKLQPAQQPAWDTYARRAQALMEDQLRGVPPPDTSEDALHQINRRVDVVRNRLAAMEDIADAAGQLYATLSPEQRKVADELLPTTVPALYSGLPDFSRGQPTTRKKGP